VIGAKFMWPPVFPDANQGNHSADLFLYLIANFWGKACNCLYNISYAPSPVHNTH